MEITLNRNSLKKALSVLIVVALFFGMCSPAAPYLPEIKLNVGAIGNINDATVIASGKCGESSSYELYKDGTLVISGSGAIGYVKEFDEFDESSGELRAYNVFDSINRSDVKKLIINNGIAAIGSGAFREFYNLEIVDMADSVVYMNFERWGDRTYGVFSGCTSLENIKFSEKLENIPEFCFSDCTSIINIEIPDSVIGISDNSFYNCINIESVKLSKSLKYLSECFKGLTKLKFIEIPSSVTEIDNEAFLGCTSLESVKFNEGLEVIGGSAFAGCYFLKAANLPSTVKTIGGSAFQDCIYLEEVTIPESVASIGAGLFTNCIRLSKVTVMNPDCEILYDRGTIPETAVIYGYSDSTAEKYANDWLRKFVPLDKEHDHEFESKVTLKATCTTTGIEEYTCYCGESRTEVIPTNYHFDVDKDDNCDMCGTKLNSLGDPVTPDQGEDNITPDDSEQQKPEEEKNIFEKFFDALINFFKKFANLFDVFKNLG